MGKGSFSDNFQAAVVGMGAIEVRLVDKALTDDVQSPKIKEVQVKGLFPITRKRHLEFVTSVFDNTSGKYTPVISSIELFQEAHSRAYQHTVEVGAIEPGTGFVGWVRVGVVIPEILEPPYSGMRKLVAFVRLVDLDDRPRINQGFHDEDDSGLLWQRALPFEYEVKSKGYLEAVEQRDKARVIAMQIAMTVAMWNGSLGDNEGTIIKNWVGKVLANKSEEGREKLKNEFNNAMKAAYEKAKSGGSSLTSLTDQMNELDEHGPKIETTELCFDVLASSSIESSDKARVVDLVAKALNLDSAEIERIRDIKIIGSKSDLPKQVRVEDLLGISGDWDSETIKRHLRTEFQKWNNRLTTLPEGEERDSAQRMLDTISEARRKYG